MRVVQGFERNRYTYYPLESCILEYEEGDLYKVIFFYGASTFDIPLPRLGWFENGKFTEENVTEPVIDGVIRFDRKTAKGWWVTVLQQPFRDVSFFIGSRAKLLELFDQQGVSIPVPKVDANGDKW